MSGRMDLEARLRALREGKRLPARPPSPPPAPLPTAASFSWPDVPSSPVKREIPVRKRVPVAAGDDYQPVRRASSHFSAAPPVTIVRRSSSGDSTTSARAPVSVEPPEATESDPEQGEVLRLTAAQLLGPEYEEAVKVAQYAIDNERRQLPHTAIDAYIQAGQMLIEIGRRQAAPHLQEIVKAKALALLQRAEGLSEWTSEVLAKDSSQQALATAYQQSQQSRSRSLTEKQELVAKMQQDNRNMKEKLNQLALLTKIRGRMMKVVKRRRARKAEEEKAREENEAAQGSTNAQGGFNDVTGEIDDYEDEGEREGPNDVIGFEDEEVNKPYQHFRATKAPETHGSPRETQKVGLINELHERIGLPQIDHLRKFEPLTSDPTADNRQEELQSELEAAKQEADKLRAAVQDMEKCLRLAAQHSKQRSMKLEKQKAQEFAEVQSELDRVREELENERRRSASFQSGPSSWRSDRSSVASDPGTDEYEDAGVMQHLRSSLHKVFRGRDELSGAGSRRASVQRTSYSHDSPRHTPKASEKAKPQTYEFDEEEMEEEDDGGVWL
ncbi:hypothetical protein P3T76_006516 [Phytophthora citrophthora]|uniref:MIT domain-containing protein n=1 Tax=Phytophthora citrophthora TaxID=4793 RepID=A0AAD9GNS3_9STRA|nr:hypothetical protein P3T76_006516 [Phytophthora citrophthora]